MGLDGWTSGRPPSKKPTGGELDQEKARRTSLALDDLGVRAVHGDLVETPIEPVVGVVPRLTGGDSGEPLIVGLLDRTEDFADGHPTSTGSSAIPAPIATPVNLIVAPETIVSTA